MIRKCALVALNLHIFSKYYYFISPKISFISNFMLKFFFFASPKTELRNYFMLKLNANSCFNAQMAIKYSLRTKFLSTNLITDELNLSTFRKFLFLYSFLKVLIIQT
jgi:hypothetical protein